MNMLTSQSTKNLASIMLGFGVGAVNTLVLYPYFFGADQQGLVVFLLSASNLLMPLIGFGVAQTIIKFHSSYDASHQQGFLSFSVLLPLVIALPLCFLAIFFHDSIAALLSVENPIISRYTWVIFSIAFATAYFEVFYSWARVHFKSVGGNMLKEIYPRISIFLLLSLYALELISLDQFFILLVGLYYLRLLLMMMIAFRIQPPKLNLYIPTNFKEVLRYSFYLVLAASAGSLIIDIDKFMLPQYNAIEQTAFYAVGIFTATLIEVPGRALFQILNPLVAKAINTNDTGQVASLYKDSSINLLLLAGWFFLLVNGSIEALFELIKDEGYGNAIWVVLMISFAKLVYMSSGASNTMLINSKKYRVALIITILMALFVVFGNLVFIPIYGINGAALSTLLVVVVFTYVRMGYVYHYFGVQPYNRNTLYAFAIIGVLFWAMSFVVFSFSPIVSILLKSTLITLVYGILVIKLKLSSTLNGIVEKRIKSKW
jgi:O-antigen/teichoic acid export membrane protein